MIKTINIPDSQAGLLNQLILALGWTFQEDNAPLQTNGNMVVKSSGEELSPLVSHFKRGKPLRVTDEELDKMRYEYLMEKLHI